MFDAVLSPFAARLEGRLWNCALRSAARCDPYPSGGARAELSCYQRRIRIGEL